MKLIVGIGNPGHKYSRTRHNVGWFVLDKLLDEIRNTNYETLNKSSTLTKDSVNKQITNVNFRTERKFNAEVLRIGNTILAKPQTFMNDSGKAVSALAAFYKLHPADIFIVHDDLDIKLGEYKIQKGTGPKVHKGLGSIDKSLGSKNYWRVRIGVENRSKAVKILGFPIRKRIPGEAYVLQEFSESELEVLHKTLDNVVDKLLEELKI